MSFRFGVDIGGTFTDIVLVADDGSVFAIGKLLTTPDAPDLAVVQGSRQLLDSTGVEPAAVSAFMHGTTLFTNALIERKGSPTALITTKGFRDIVEIAREHRYDLYDLRLERPQPLAPRHLRFEVDERVLADGSIRLDLDEAQVRAVCCEVAASGVEAVAICLINSYVNPSHELRVAEILREIAPELAMTASCDLVPEIREYERTSTVLANVYIKKIAENYLGRLRTKLSTELGLSCQMFVVQSSGGVCEVETALQHPIKLVESGPAAGAIAAACYGKLIGHKDLLAFDMGGTTAKACVIADGEPLIAQTFEVDRRYQFKKGSGLPITTPVIELIEIGTGGGSIAGTDGLMRLVVGPHSAGSKPGPACYGRGGTEPTVTDADLVLGYLNPSFFLGGRMALDAEAAHRAIADRVGTPLGLSVGEAAWGIHRLANESMASAARIHAIERGRNVESFPLFAFGGAGPLHAFGVANILRSPRVIYPLGAGVMSAIGFLAAPLALTFVRSLPGDLETIDWTKVQALLAGMEEEGAEILSKTISADQVSFRRFADLRYRRQGYEIRVPVPDGTLDESCRSRLCAGFERLYESLYGHIMHDTPIEAVSWRVVASGPMPALTLPRPEGRGDPVKGERSVYISASKGFQTVPVYDRYALAEGFRAEGPALFEERECTVVVNGPASISVDGLGNVIVDLVRPV